MLKILAPIIAAVTIILSGTSAQAQVPSTETKIFIPDSAINSPIAPWLQRPEALGVDTRGEELGSLRFVVERQVCTEVSLTDDSSRVQGGKLASIGTAGQPAVCSRAGARIDVFDSLGRHLAATFVVQPGSTFELGRDLPFSPPSTGEGIIPPSTGSAGISGGDSGVRLGLFALGGSLLGIFSMAAVKKRRRAY